MKRWIVISLLAIVAVTAVISYVVFVRPELLRDRIPMHWDLQMEPDAWTDRAGFAKVLFAFPAVMLLFVALMVLLPRISPKNFEVDRFAGTFGFLMTSIVIFFGYLGLLMVWVGIQDHPLWTKCFVASFFLLFAVIGNAIGKVQRNFWMGIRTPWTLASDTVWNRTHRITAWLWVAAGLVGAFAIMLGMPLWMGFILILIVALYPALYSLALYKSLEKQGKL